MKGAFVERENGFTCNTYKSATSKCNKHKTDLIDRFNPNIVTFEIKNLTLHE